MSGERDEAAEFKRFYGTRLAPQDVWAGNDELRAFRERYRKWLAENQPEFLQLAKGPGKPISRNGTPERRQFQDFRSSSTTPEDLRIVDDEDRAFQERYRAWLAANPPEMTEEEANKWDYPDFPDSEEDRARHRRFREWLKRNTKRYGEMKFEELRRLKMSPEKVMGSSIRDEDKAFRERYREWLAKNPLESST